jgi:hypothetical protein
LNFHFIERVSRGVPYLFFFSFFINGNVQVTSEKEKTYRDKNKCAYKASRPKGKERKNH